MTKEESEGKKKMNEWIKIKRGKKKDLIGFVCRCGMCQCSFVGIYFQIQRPVVETAAVALKKGTGARVWCRVA